MGVATHRLLAWRPQASIVPAAWSFMLAARARGLRTVWTTFHLRHERETAQLLAIPFDEVMHATRCRLAGFEPQLAWLRAGEPFDLQTVPALVSNGVGVCLRTNSLPCHDASGVVSRPVLERAPSVKLAIAWRREDPPPFLEPFLRIAREAVPHRQLPAWS